MHCQSENCNLFAVVPAAGSSSRMKTPSPGGSKIFLSLKNGRTVLEQSLESLRLAGVRSCVIPSSKKLIEEVNDHIKVHIKDWDNLVAVEGGETRFDSVFRGISYLKNNYSITPESLLVIHDAARPFCTSELIKSAINLAKSGERDWVGLTVCNTRKECGGNC